MMKQNENFSSLSQIEQDFLSQLPQKFVEFENWDQVRDVESRFTIKMRNLKLLEITGNPIENRKDYVSVRKF